MIPEVYGFPHSPFVIAVESALRALNVEFVSHQVSSADRSAILRLTDGAYYEVPVLVAAGKTVFESAPDSQDVARFIDEHFGNGRLFPDSLRGLQDLVIRYLENDVEGVSFRVADPFYVDSLTDLAERGMVIRHKERKLGKGCVDQWRTQHDELLRETARLLDPLEQMLGRSRFLFGSEPVYADFLLAGLLGNLTYGGHVRIPESLPAIQRFHIELQRFRYNDC